MKEQKLTELIRSENKGKMVRPTAHTGGASAFIPWVVGKRGVSICLSNQLARSG